MIYRQFIPLVGGFEAWRQAARQWLASDTPPHDIVWTTDAGCSHLFGSEQPPRKTARPAAVPAAFVEMARLAVCHRDAARFSRLYEMLWRLQHEPRLLSDNSDRLVSTLRQMCKAVSRDSHKMKAFVRFQEVESGGADVRRRFAAWFEPEHHVVELTAPFFTRRFADMDWVIATPLLTARWANGALSFLRTAERPAARTDVTTALWQTYYASIFNPARLKTKAMKAEMPQKSWKNLPEAALIPELIVSASTRTADMQIAGPTTPARRIPSMAETFVESPSQDGGLGALRHAAMECRLCDLCTMATQTVFGEGPENASLMLVGEQPGDKEDLAGRPFVGPAGALLDRALKAAGIDRASAYLTNAVKHFKYEPRGKLRLHKSPSRSEVSHCRWWIKQEIALVRPRLIVALGGTAALSLTGSSQSILRRRGQIETLQAMTPVLVTVHPSSILRTSQGSDNEQAFAEFVSDLKQAAMFLDGISSSKGSAAQLQANRKQGDQVIR